MTLFSLIFTVAGLCVFEIMSSIDNAIINAEVLTTMSKRARVWFMAWGLFIAVFLVRGLLPWLIVWATTPSLGPIQAFTASFSSDPKILDALEKATPFLLLGGGIFLLLLFFHWLFLEQKEFGLRVEKFFTSQGVWFFAISSALLASLVWAALHINPFLAFAATLGSTAFFITHGFKEHAAQSERELINKKNLSDLSKLLYLEIIDATFSIDGVLGAFAFTLAVPLILLGNGIGAFVVRELTLKNIEHIRAYRLLKNGAMYSILCLGSIMVMESFGFHIPVWVAPLITFCVVGYFFQRSYREIHYTNICQK